jgi:peptide/nickel transport system permease protein
VTSIVNVFRARSTEPDPDAYYTAGQWQLAWQRFRRHKMALLGAGVLGVMLMVGLLSNFVAPYLETQRDANYLYGGPQIPNFWDSNGFSLVPFVHGVTTTRDPVTLRAVSVPDESVRHHLRLFVDGAPYNFYGISLSTHLFGVDGGGIHLFGTDELGRDVFSRTLIATRTSLTIGIIGVLVAFVLALVIGGVAGYFGGFVDAGLGWFTDIIRVVPVIPLFMGLAAAFPTTWTNEQVYFAMSLLFGLLGWPTLARRTRSYLMTQRNEDYILAARLAGGTPARIISRHLLPSFSSYIIVDLVISFPYMILSETALSFIGLGLRPPSVSWGVLLQDAQNIRAIEQAPWLFLPALFVIVAVISFVIVGDGARDASDPYTA